MLLQHKVTAMVSLCGDGKHQLLLSLKLSMPALQDWGMLLQVQLLLLVGNLLRKQGSVASWLVLAAFWGPGRSTALAMGGLLTSLP